MEILSAGTSGTSAENFFARLKDARASTVVDTRLHPDSQLAAFAKSRDLPYFLDSILGIGYTNEPLLYPEQEMLTAYRKNEINWAEYEVRYVALLAKRDVEHRIDRTLWGERPVLLCSEHTPDKCHRRLAADYLREGWGESSVSRIVHL